MEDSKVDSILNAARKRFAHYGIAKTTMNDIAMDINMSKASLYYYFPDKERIFVAVVEKDMSEFVSVVQTLIEKPSKASYKLKKYVTRRNDLLTRLLNLAKVETLSPRDVLNPLFDDLRRNFTKERDLIRQIIQHGIQENEFEKVSADAYADLFVSTLVGLRATMYTIKMGNEFLERTDDQSVLFVDVFLKAVRNLPLPEVN